MGTAPGVKHDGEKIRADLCLGGFARALIAVSEIGTFGARKYSDYGWVSVPDGIRRYSDAMLRHYLHESLGEERDSESGLLHAAHLAWNALARLDLMLRASSSGMSRRLSESVPHEALAKLVDPCPSEELVKEALEVLRQFGKIPPTPSTAMMGKEATAFELRSWEREHGGKFHNCAAQLYQIARKMSNLEKEEAPKPKCDRCGSGDPARRGEMCLGIQEGDFHSLRSEAAKDLDRDIQKGPRTCDPVEP